MLPSLQVLLTVKNLKDINACLTLLRKAGLDTRLMEFLVANKRTEENFRALFTEKGLAEIVNLQKNMVRLWAKFIV